MLPLVGISAAGRNDVAGIDEGVGDLDRLVEQPAWIVAQIEDIALQFRLTGFGAEMIEGLAHPVVRLLIELGDADIADVAALQMRAHRLNVDDLADDRELLEVPVRSALDGQFHRRLGRAPHFFDRFLEGQALDRSVVDAGDQIAGHHASARRRRIVDRADHLDQPILHHHFEAEAAEFLALHAALEVLQGFRIKII